MAAKLTARQKLRALLERPGLTAAAPIFDPLSARIVDLQGWEVCKVSGSVGKFSNLAVPDSVAMANISDQVDLCHRITRVCDLPLIIDADDGGGNALNVFRTVRELEGAGVAAIEIEDNAIPRHFGEAERRHALMVSKAAHVGKLQAAVQARRDPGTVIVARTSALHELPRDEAMERIRAYSETGVDAIMFPRLPHGRADLETAMQATHLPLMVLAVAEEIANDAELIARARLKIRFIENRVYPAIVKALDDSFRLLKNGGDPDSLVRATADLLRAVNRSDEMLAWQEKYLRD